MLTPPEPRGTEVGAGRSAVWMEGLCGSEDRREDTERLRRAAARASMRTHRGGAGRALPGESLTLQKGEKQEVRQPQADVGHSHSQVYFPTRHPSSTAADGLQLRRLRKGC